jgi:hypothetical protein
MYHDRRIHKTPQYIFMRCRHCLLHLVAVSFLKQDFKFVYKCGLCLCCRLNRSEADISDVIQVFSLFMIASLDARLDVISLRKGRTIQFRHPRRDFYLLHGHRDVSHRP